MYQQHSWNNTAYEQLGQPCPEMLQSLEEQYGMVRVHGARIFVLDEHGPNRTLLDRRAAETPGAFVAWEPQGVMQPDQRHVGPRYALWLPYTPPPGQADELSTEQPAVAHDQPETQDNSAPAPKRAARGPKTTRHKNITRIDHPPKRTHGYFVRVRWKGQNRSRFFSDKKHGDRLAALTAAIEWRDATEQELGKPRTDRLVIGQPRSSNTGVVGVRRRTEGHTEYMEATWVNERGTLSRTRFSIARYGVKGALRRAQKAREQHERDRWKTPSPDEERNAAMP
jgi:hypothetical protein